jgi:hypothetical protein
MLAWTIEGKRSTAQLDSEGSRVRFGVEMNSQIGGGDASPVRDAYMYINGKMMPAAWIVGASMDTIETNNRAYTLVVNSSAGNYLNSIGINKKEVRLDQVSLQRKRNKNKR